MKQIKFSKGHKFGLKGKPGHYVVKEVLSRVDAVIAEDEDSRRVTFNQLSGGHLSVGSQVYEVAS